MAQSTIRPKGIDARGSYCPSPLMELVRNIREGNVGDVFEIWSSDWGSQRDIPRWAEKAGHQVLSIIHEKDYDRIVVRKSR
ncbi:MAG TPA: sulfurtransferase TusA family protein [Nitrososphaerales archaeon]|nr:sulfurtransferase TusA family protein [Nitrososphaerales archaeon]